MADGEEQRKLAVAVKDTVTGVVKDSSGKMAEFHEDTAAIGEETSQALVDEDANIAEEDAAAKVAADKAAEEAAARRAEKAAVPKRIGELRTQGHGPARHLDATDKQIEDRLGKPIMQGNPPRPHEPGRLRRLAEEGRPGAPGAGGLPDTDPLTYKDMYRTNAAGNPMNHSCGQYSTAFGDPESMVKADAAARVGIPAGASGREAVTIDAQSAIGADGVAGLRGRYIDPMRR